jgi:homocysteine S-methyltransferase
MSKLLDYNPFKAARLKGKPLVLDGAIGSYLQQKGKAADNTLWASIANKTDPQAVIQLHQEYIEAGADIITTNTFRTNPLSLNNSDIDDQLKFVKDTVDLARQRVRNKKVLIAGSNPPAEDCYQKERTITHEKLELNHRKHIDLLVNSRVNFILNETQSHFDEIRIICEHCNKNKIPYVVSLYVDESLRILSGESLESVLKFLNTQNLLAVGFNCISPNIHNKILRSIKLPNTWGFYLNCGSEKPTDQEIHCAINPDEYAKYVSNVLRFKPSFIGSCCGSSPEHTKKLRKFIDGKANS